MDKSGAKNPPAPGLLRSAPDDADMLLIIGKLPGQEGVWCVFGHAYQGLLTLGPTTGRLLADMMTGAAPFLDPEPYRPA